MSWYHKRVQAIQERQKLEPKLQNEEGVNDAKSF